MRLTFFHLLLNPKIIRILHNLYILLFFHRLPWRLRFLELGKTRSWWLERKFTFSLCESLITWCTTWLFRATLVYFFCPVYLLLKWNVSLVLCHHVELLEIQRSYLFCHNWYFLLVNSIIKLCYCFWFTISWLSHIRCSTWHNRIGSWCLTRTENSSRAQ